MFTRKIQDSGKKQEVRNNTVTKSTMKNNLPNRVQRDWGMVSWGKLSLNRKTWNRGLKGVSSETWRCNKSQQEKKCRMSVPVWEERGWWWQGEKEGHCRTQESWWKQETSTAKAECLRSVRGCMGLGVGGGDRLWGREVNTIVQSRRAFQPL